MAAAGEISGLYLTWPCNPEVLCLGISQNLPAPGISDTVVYPDVAPASVTLAAAETGLLSGHYAKSVVYSRV